MGDLDQKPAYNFRILRELADDRWREFDHKTRLEWKLSFALWLALLAAIAALGRGEFGVIANGTCMMAAVPIVIIIPALHFLFACWIQARVQEIRKDMWEIYKVRWNRAFDGVQRKDGPLVRNPKDQPTLLIQIMITCLLALMLLAVAWSCGKATPRPTPQGVATVASQQASTPGTTVKTNEVGAKP